jgi:hypothetical protein
LNRSKKAKTPRTKVTGSSKLISTRSAPIYRYPIMLTDAIRAYELSDYRWDRERNIYTYPNGKRVPDRALYGAIRRYENKLEQSLQSATTALLNGDLPLSEWQKRVASRVKESHLELLRFGAGGQSRVWQESEVERHLQKVDFPALDRFGKDLVEGKLSEKQIRARVALYASSPKVSYERGRVSVNREKGVRYGRRLLGRTDFHCPDCIAYASLGWQRLEDVILPGTECQCGVNCLCSIEVAGKIPDND